VSIVEATRERPYDVGVVILPPLDENSTSGWSLEMSYLPGIEDKLDEVTLIQCFVPIPVTLSKVAIPELTRAIATLHSKLPLVGFGYLETHDLVFFRHVLMLPDNDYEGNRSVLLETIKVIWYLADSFAEAVKLVAQGQATADQALAEVRHSGIFT